MYGKHKAVVSALLSIQVDTVIALDQPYNSQANHPGSETLRTYLLQLRHSTTDRKLFHSVDWSTSFQDAGTNAIVLMTFPEHYTEASAIASVLPALCDQNLSAQTNQWFTSEALDICNEVEFLPNSMEFRTQDESLFTDMLSEDFGTTAQVELEGLHVVAEEANQSRRRPRSDDASFHSFATITGGKRNLGERQHSETASDSISSPTMSQEVSSTPAGVSQETFIKLQEKTEGIQSENERLKAELAALTLRVHPNGAPPITAAEPSIQDTSGPRSQPGSTDDDAYPSDRSFHDESTSAQEKVIDLRASSSSISTDDSQSTAVTANSLQSIQSATKPSAGTKSSVAPSSTGGDQASL